MMRKFWILILLVGVWATLSNCGRRSALDTPYQAAIDKAKDDNSEQAKPTPEKPEADRPFFLDPLIN